MLTIDIDTSPKAFVRNETVGLTINGKRQEVEITTEGWEEVLREWIEKNPQPIAPYTEETIRPGTPEARRFKHRKGIATRKVYDEMDSTYRVNLSRWNNDSNFVVVAHCLRIDLTKGDVSITDVHERAKALRQLGMTDHQADRLYQEIVELSKDEDQEAADFTEESSEQPGS